MRLANISPSTLTHALLLVTCDVCPMLSCIASAARAAVVGWWGGSLHAMRMRALSRSNCGDPVQVVLVSAAVHNAQCISYSMICVEIQELSAPAFFKRKIAAL